MDEKYLRRFWKKYIDRNLYRVVSEEYLLDIKKNGLNPKKDPYQKIIPEIKKLFMLVLKLEKKGFVHEQDWGFKVVQGSYVVKISTTDIESPFIDITPRYKETFFYKKHRGGALVKTIKTITEDILDRKPTINEKESELVKKLNKWAVKKFANKNKTLFFKGSSKYFETAHFQAIHFDKKYWESPFGRFNHFKKVIEKNGFNKYKDFLTGKRIFYLRLIKKIPAKEIIKIV